MANRRPRGRPPTELTAERERRAWELRLQGWTQQQIADVLGIDQSSVSDALRRIEQRLYKELSGTAAEIKSRQTAQLEYIYGEAVSAWQRSKQDAKSREVTKQDTDLGTGNEGDGEGCSIPAVAVKTKTVRKGQSGNPALLAQAQAALDAIRAIWGIEEPKRQQISGDPNNPVPVMVLGNVKTEEL